MRLKDVAMQHMTWAVHAWTWTVAEAGMRTASSVRRVCKQCLMAGRTPLVRRPAHTLTPSCSSLCALKHANDCQSNLILLWPACTGIMQDTVPGAAQVGYHSRLSPGGALHHSQHCAPSSIMSQMRMLQHTGTSALMDRSLGRL